MLIICREWESLCKNQEKNENFFSTFWWWCVVAHWLKVHDLVQNLQAWMAHIFSIESKILALDVSQKLRQTKSLLFNFWIIKIDKNTNFAKFPSAKWLFVGIPVNFSLQISPVKFLRYITWFKNKDLPFNGENVGYVNYEYCWDCKTYSGSVPLLSAWARIPCCWLCLDPYCVAQLLL